MLHLLAQKAAGGCFEFFPFDIYSKDGSLSVQEAPSLQNALTHRLHINTHYTLILVDGGQETSVTATF